MPFNHCFPFPKSRCPEFETVIKTHIWAKLHKDALSDVLRIHIVLYKIVGQASEIRSLPLLSPPLFICYSVARAVALELFCFSYNIFIHFLKLAIILLSFRSQCELHI